MEVSSPVCLVVDMYMCFFLMCGPDTEMTLLMVDLPQPSVLCASTLLSEDEFHSTVVMP